MDNEIIGCKVVILTTFGQKLEGEIHAIDNRTNMVVVKRPGSKSGRSNLIFLKQNFIKDVVDVEPRKQQENKIPYVNLDECRRREEKAVQSALEAASKIGVGVSKEAQGIFDALSKTLPCRWQGKSILVMDYILIREPYEGDNCSLVDEKDSSTIGNQLDRIKFQLNNVRRSLNLSYSGPAYVSPSPSPPPPQIAAAQLKQALDENSKEGED